MDLLSSFLVRNYEYPGQSPLWVAVFVFFGWVGTCSSCLLLAEGILARPGGDMLTEARLWWQVPLLTAAVAVALDMFVDPVAVRAGYWAWLVPATVYYGHPPAQFRGLVRADAAGTAGLDSDRPKSPVRGWPEGRDRFGSPAPLVSGFGSAFASAELGGHRFRVAVSLRLGKFDS